MALLLLSYDTTKEEYAAKNFRVALIRILLDNGAKEPKSYAASTIHFKTRKPVESWVTILENNVKQGFRYIICEVSPDENNLDDGYALRYRYKGSQRRNFAKEVREIEKFF